MDFESSAHCTAALFTVITEKNMKLTKRLQEILDYCPKLERWADVGCDHGRLSCSLILSGKAEVVFAADISAPSLSKAGELAKLIGIEDRIQLRLGDGLLPITGDDVQGVVMSGMGGPLILDILEASPETAEKLEYMVLSPQKYPERVRKYLNEKGWTVEKECIIEEAGKYYPVMLVKKGKDDVYTDAELLTGRNVRYDADYEKYLRYKIGFWENVAEGVSDEALIADIQEKLDAYRGVYKNTFDIA